MEEEFSFKDSPPHSSNSNPIKRHCTSSLQPKPVVLAAFNEAAHHFDQLVVFLKQHVAHILDLLVSQTQLVVF